MHPRLGGIGRAAGSVFAAAAYPSSSHEILASLPSDGSHRRYAAVPSNVGVGGQSWRPARSSVAMCRTRSATRRLSSHRGTQPRLAYEWIVDGKVVPHTSTIDGSSVGGDGKEVIVFLHGLLGNAKNVRTPAKKLTQQLPHLNALLLDIRGHGNSSPSSTARSFVRPHNFHSCVEDVVETLVPLGLTGRNSPAAICGHSLGGRIALQYSHSLCTATSPQLTAVKPPRQTWVLDSVPGRPDPSVHNVLRAISSLPTPVPSKAWLIETLAQEHKMDKGVVMWIATNLRDAGDGQLGWVFDLGIANELVEGFSSQDLAGLIRSVTLSDRNVGGGGSEVRLVRAGRNRAWSEEIISELESIPSFQRSSPSLFQIHTLEKAGHWVHVDDVDGLVGLMVGGLQK